MQTVQSELNTSKINPSSMACFIEYKWNGLNVPSSCFVPNRSNVAFFGVAVKAK
jgi:hypothetical protein